MWFLDPAHFSHSSVSSCVSDVPPTLVILTASPCASEVGSTHTLQWSFAFEIGESSRNYVVFIFSLQKYFWCVIKRETPLAKVCSLSRSLIFPPKRLLFLSLSHLGPYRMDHVWWLWGTEWAIIVAWELCVMWDPGNISWSEGHSFWHIWKGFFLSQDS